MNKRFEETDLSRVRPVPISGRRSRVTLADIVDPRGIRDAEAARSALLSALPGVLAAGELRNVADALREKRDHQREIVWLIGAHTIKTGLSRYLSALMERGFITAIASTGSSVIHDLELAFFGKTSEDVAAELPEGRFGMSAETASHFNDAIRMAHRDGLGLGQGFGRHIVEAKAPHAEVSVFAAAHRLDIPATVHVAFGTDITHQHPGFPAAETGELTMRDFRVLTHRVGRLFDRGAVVLVGSAVVLPEVFLKAVSINYHLGLAPSGVTAVNLDMQPQYRVRENVLSRPFRGQASASAIIGHHEILIPLLYLLLGE